MGAIHPGDQPAPVLLITGAAGFIGINLAKWFAAAGYRVLAHDHRPPPRDASWFLGSDGDKVDWFEGDIRDGVHLEAIIQTERPSKIVHTAAITPADDQVERTRARDIIEVNVLGTIALMEAANNSDISRILFIGSCSALGNLGLSGSEDELESRWETLYGVSKLTQELVVRRFAALFGLPAITVRVSQPYGPMERPTPDRTSISPIGEWIEAAASGKPLEVVDPEVQRDWIHVSDLARAIHALVAAPEPRHASYGVGYGKLVSVKEVLAALCRAFPLADVRHRPEATPNRNLLPAALQPPLMSARLFDEFGFRPEFDIVAGLADYGSFLKARLSADETAESVPQVGERADL